MKNKKQALLKIIAIGIQIFLLLCLGASRAYGNVGTWAVWVCIALLMTLNLTVFLMINKEEK
jgi:ABC-type multidrug transport system permease subunit